MNVPWRAERQECHVKCEGVDKTACGWRVYEHKVTARIITNMHVRHCRGRARAGKLRNDFKASAAASLGARQGEQSCEATLVGVTTLAELSTFLEFVGKVVGALQLRPWTIVAELCGKIKHTRCTDRVGAHACRSASVSRLAWRHCDCLYSVISLLLWCCADSSIIASLFWPCKRINPVSSCCTNCPSITTQASPSLFCHGNRILLCSSCRAARGAFALSRSHPRPHINRRAGCTVLTNSLLCNLCSPACCSVGLLISRSLLHLSPCLREAHFVGHTMAVSGVRKKSNKPLCMSHSIQHYSSTLCLAEQSVDLKSDFFFIFIFFYRVWTLHLAKVAAAQQQLSPSLKIAMVKSHLQENAWKERMICLCLQPLQECSRFTFLLVASDCLQGGGSVGRSSLLPTDTWGLRLNQSGRFGRLMISRFARH